MVPVMIEMLRFFWDEDLLIETSAAISQITGEEFGGVVGDWSQWMEWLGRNADEYQPPEGYVAWKSTLMSLIDPRFGDFLLPAEPTVPGSTWPRSPGAASGPTAFRTFRTPRSSSAEEQDYLLPGDRVFGVSINGEHRAYPSPHRERPRDGQRRAGRRTHRAGLLNPLRHRNRVFRQDQRTADHLRHVGNAVPQQQGDVRPPDQLSLEPAHQRAGHRAAMGLGDQAGLLSGHAHHLGGVAGASSRHHRPQAGHRHL